MKKYSWGTDDQGIITLMQWDTEDQMVVATCRLNMADSDHLMDQLMRILAIWMFDNDSYHDARQALLSSYFS